MSILVGSPQILSYVEQSGAITWGTAMSHAAMMGDLDALKLLSVQNTHTSVQTACFAKACEYGHRHIVIFFLDHIKQFQIDQQSYDILRKDYCQVGFLAASKGGHLDIVQLILEHHKPSAIDVQSSVEAACSTCSWDVIFYSKERFNISRIRALQNACEGRHRKLVDWLIEQGDDSWGGGVMGACISGDVPLIQLMIKHGATNTLYGVTSVLYRAFDKASQKGHLEACKYLLESGSIKFNEISFFSQCDAKIKKLLISYDDRRIVPVYAADICPLLNEGVSLDILLKYRYPETTTRIVDLAKQLLEVVQLSLRGVLCSDLLTTLQTVIGYDVNEQVIQSIKSCQTGRWLF